MKNQNKKYALTGASILLFCICSLSLLSAVKHQEQHRYTISGVIHGVHAKWVIICYADRPGKGVKVDSVKINNEKFKLEGEVTVPQPVLLGIRYGKGRGVILYHEPIILDSGNLMVEAETDSMTNLRAWGTKGQDEFNEFKQKMSPISNALNRIAGIAYTAKKDDQKLTDSLDEAKRYYNNQITGVVENHVKKYPASIISAYIMRVYLVDSDYKTLASLYGVLTDDVKNSLYGKQLSERLNEKRRTAVGMPAPNFSLRDKNNRIVSLKSYRGKWVLVDFWASWCGPCRKENPNLTRTYTSFKKNGFEIISISVDKDKKAWLNAVKQDKLNWTQLISSQSTVSADYGISAIPMNFLLDKEGKIIAENLRGKELKEKLISLFK